MSRGLDIEPDDRRTRPRVVSARGTSSRAIRTAAPRRWPPITSACRPIVRSRRSGAGDGVSVSATRRVTRSSRSAPSGSCSGVTSSMARITATRRASPRMWSRFVFQGFLGRRTFASDDQGHTLDLLAVRGGRDSREPLQDRRRDSGQEGVVAGHRHRPGRVRQRAPHSRRGGEDRGRRRARTSVRTRTASRTASGSIPANASRPAPGRRATPLAN